MKKPLFVTIPNKTLHQATKKVVNFDKLPRGRADGVFLPDKFVSIGFHPRVKPTGYSTSENKALKNQIAEMTEALQSEAGVGLAANQVGFSNSVIIVECPYKDRGIIPLTVFVNPEICSYSEETDIYDEGCLSLPPIELETERSKKIKVKYQDENGKSFKITPKGFLARILQHEIDHLHGILFTDRVKEKYFKTYPKLKKMKIVFIGSGDFAEVILKGMLALDYNIPLIITEAAKPAGRNKELRPTKVADLAKLFGKNLLETTSIKDNTDQIKKIAPDFIILTDFGQIIPNEILEIPLRGALNLHPSLLPKYRGATPIQSAILAGDKETGVSLIQMVPAVDKGPVFTQIKAEIYEDDNSLTLEKRLAVFAMKLLYFSLPHFIEKMPKPLIQDENQVSKTHKFTKEEGQIDWNKKPEEIDRQIRAFFPWPGSYTFLGSMRLIIHSAHLDNNKLILDVVQPEGKNPMSFADFLKGYNSQKPDWLKKLI